MTLVVNISKWFSYKELYSKLSLKPFLMGYYEAHSINQFYTSNDYYNAFTSNIAHQSMIYKFYTTVFPDPALYLTIAITAALLALAYHHNV